MWKPILKATVFVAALGGAVALAIASYDPEVDREARRLEGELTELQGVNRTLQARNAELTRTLESLHSRNTLLEKVARDDLGYIKEGEIVVILPD
jgi:cell division protein FtsB